MIRRLVFGAIGLSIIAALPALGDDVPFAEAPPPMAGLPRTPELTLADVMGKIQLRHIKIWDSIKFKNWALLSYELGQTKDAFNNAVILYRNIPVELIIAADKPLMALQEAAKAKDASKLERNFAEFTSACNGCHMAAEVGFIQVKTPTSSPFSDQDFSPKK